MVRIELTTSSLPRKRSTTELLRLVFLTLSFENLAFHRRGIGFSVPPPVWSGRRGSNPPPIAWKAIALPNELLPLLLSFWHFVGEGGLEPPNSSEDRFTVCCNCHYATSPSSDAWRTFGRADEGTRTPDRLITNQLLYQLSYIGFSQRFKQLSFLDLRLQKYNYFRYMKIFFQLFLIKTCYYTDFHNK